MSASFEGKTALITGGSSGMGLALGKQLAQAGASVAILARDPAKLEAACGEIKASRKSEQQTIRQIQADVSDFEGVTQVLDADARQFGAPDFLFNCAGFAIPKAFIDQDIAEIRSQIDTNLMGTIIVTRALLPYMVQRRSGYIVNVSSIAGYLGLYGYSSYGASKFGVRGFSDAILYELEEYGIRVSVVFPPDMLTPGLEHENTIKSPVTKVMDENNKAMTADAVAAATLKGVARNKHLITPGFDSAFYMALINSVGYLVYPVMKLMVSDAQRKVRKAKNNGAH